LLRWHLANHLRRWHLATIAPLAPGTWHLATTTPLAPGNAFFRRYEFISAHQSWDWYFRAPRLHYSLLQLQCCILPGLDSSADMNSYLHINGVIQAAHCSEFISVLHTFSHRILGWIDPLDFPMGWSAGPQHTFFRRILGWIDPRDSNGLVRQRLQKQKMSA